MFTLEIRINQNLIGHIYGVNQGKTDTDGKGDYYSFSHYSPETQAVIHGKLRHQRDDGINALVIKVLQSVEQMKSAEFKTHAGSSPAGVA